MLGEKTLGIVFSNLHGDNIRELTERRTMASVPFGGRYRLIDFTLSNMVNSGITSVGVITKRNYYSLMDHLGSGADWDLARKRDGLYILPPMTLSSGGSGVYTSRIDALANVLGFIRASKAKYILLADANIVYNMDYSSIARAHKDSGADITMLYQKGTVTGSLQSTPDKSIALDVSPDGKINSVIFNTPADGNYNLSMNVWFMKKVLLEQLIFEAMSDNKSSFYRDIIFANLGRYDIRGYEYMDHARTIDSMRNFFSANMELLNRDVRSELFKTNQPIYTKVRDEVPVIYGIGARVSNSMIADGCTIEGDVENCIIFRGVKVGKGARLRNSIIMQGSIIGAGADLNYVVTDKEVLVKDNRVMMGYISYPVFIEKGSTV